MKPGSFTERVQKLIELYQVQKADLKNLSDENKQLKQEVEFLVHELEKIKQEYKTYKISNVMVSGGLEVHEAKREVRRLVREIENCIALLNT